MEDTTTNHLRTFLLIERRRFREALGLVEEGLADAPGDAWLHYQRALCFLGLEEPGPAREAVEAALGLEPNEAQFHSLRANILLGLNKKKEALAAAEETVRLAPDSADAHATLAGALCSLSRWERAEAAARRALELEPENAQAGTLLSHTLRLQGKSALNTEQIAGMLARDPEDSDTHAAAGWQHLQDGRREEAERHFLEALRLSPEDRFAREGLLNSFRARSPLYRVWLRYAFWMSRLSEGTQLALIFGAYFVANFIGGPIFWVYIFWVLSSHLAPGVGNFIVLADSRARQALRRREVYDGLAVGGLFMLAIALAVACYALHSEYLYRLAIAAGVLALPASHVFLNRRPLWTILFSVAAGLALVCFLAFAFLMPLAPTAELALAVMTLWYVGVGVALLSTLLALFRVFERRER
ncbi:MAG: tetratricopeptide repeat protein [Verrucomicrobiota bacterium]